MNCKELSVNDTTKGNKIKAIHQYIIYILIIFIFALISKIEKTCHLATFMVASQKINRIRVIKFHRKQENQHLNRERSPVDEVPQKQILGILRVAPYLKYFYEIIELTIK
jgi:hypothetical protein